MKIVRHRFAEKPPFCGNPGNEGYIHCWTEDIPVPRSGRELDELNDWLNEESRKAHVALDRWRRRRPSVEAA